MARNRQDKAETWDQTRGTEGASFHHLDSLEEESCQSSRFGLEGVEEAHMTGSQEDGLGIHRWADLTIGCEGHSHAAATEDHVLQFFHLDEEGENHSSTAR